MYRFLLRPKWLLFHIAILTSVVGMLLLARWQWDRHIARDAFVNMVHGRQDAEPTDLAPQLAAGSDAAKIEWLVVRATGTYLPGGQLTQINRTQNGVNGINVLTPFQIDGGPIIIVNRGFVPDGTTVSAAPTESLLIGGTARTSQKRKTGELTDNESAGNTEIRRVDLAVISKLTNLELAPVYIDFKASVPASATPPVPVPPPNLGSGPPHVSYTGQWIFFSLCAIAGWVFAVRRSAKTRRQEAETTDELPATPSV